MRRRQLLRGGFAATAAAAANASVPILPLSAMDEVWRDNRRQRSLPIRIRWPEHNLSNPSAVLFSHGLGGSREGGAVWGQAWADAGFVVLHLQHPGSDIDAVRASWRDAMAPVQLLHRLGDVQFVLDEMARRQPLPDSPWAAVDVQRVGMSGHSFGAHTTLGMAGQRYPGFGGIHEPRLAAFLALSPSAPAQDAEQMLAGVNRPVLCMTGTLDEDVVGNGATPQRRRALFEALPPGDKAMLLIENADHMSFAGQTGSASGFLRRSLPPRQLQAQHHQLVAQISVDWWHAHLRGDGQAAARLQAPAGLTPGAQWFLK